MNSVTAVTVAQEFVMPSMTQDNGTAVAFFKAHQQDLMFCIPTENEATALGLAIQFQELIVRAIARYEELTK